MRESTACPSITSGKSSKATKEAFSAKLVGRLPCTFVIKDLGPEYEGSAVVHVVSKESFFFSIASTQRASKTGWTPRPPGNARSAPAYALNAHCLANLYFVEDSTSGRDTKVVPKRVFVLTQVAA